MSALLYATPSFDKPCWEYVASRDAIMRTTRSFSGGVEFIVRKGHLPGSRNKITDAAAQRGCEYVVMHDDDLWVDEAMQVGTKEKPAAVHPVDYFHEFMDLNPRVAMVGAVHLQEYPTLPSIRVFHPDHSEFKAGKFVTDRHISPLDCYVVRGIKPEPQEFPIIATGFVMVRMAAIADLKEREKGLPTWRKDVVQHEVNQPLIPTEDVDFCYRLAKYGWKVAVEPRIDTTHFKHTGVLGWNLKRWEAQEPKSISFHPLKNPVVKPYKDTGLYFIDPLAKG